MSFAPSLDDYDPSSGAQSWQRERRLREHRERRQRQLEAKLEARRQRLAAELAEWEAQEQARLLATQPQAGEAPLELQTVADAAQQTQDAEAEQHQRFDALRQQSSSGTTGSTGSPRGGKPKNAKPAAAPVVIPKKDAKKDKKKKKKDKKKKDANEEEDPTPEDPRGRLLYKILSKLPKELCVWWMGLLPAYHWVHQVSPAPYDYPEHLAAVKARREARLEALVDEGLVQPEVDDPEDTAKLVEELESDEYQPLELVPVLNRDGEDAGKEPVNRGVAKVGIDLYVAAVVLELVCTVYLLFAYNQMATTLRGDFSSSLSSNYFPGMMVLVLFFQVLFIVFDRVCYLFRSVTGKLVLTWVAVVFWMDMIFFEWPASSQAGFAHNSVLVFFFLLKLVYLSLSCIQIRLGYPPAEAAQQFLTKRPGGLRGTIFGIYRSIPFLFELRSILDWMSSRTTLSLWENFKFLDIHATLFGVQCAILDRKARQRGQATPMKSVVLNGVCVFLILLFVIFLPLLLFSSFNPATKLNNVVSADFSLRIVTEAGSYPMASVSSMGQLRQCRKETEFRLMQQLKIVVDEPVEQCQVVRLAEFSDDFWRITPPSLVQLMNSLERVENDVVELQMNYRFGRPGPEGGKEVYGNYNTLLDDAAQRQLARVINGSVTDTWKVVMAHASPTYLSLPATGDPEILGRNRSDLTMTLRPAEGAENNTDTSSGRYYWEVTTGATQGVQWITVSASILTGILAMSVLQGGVIAVYVTVVLTVGRFVRMAFSNQIERIMFEDGHDVDDLIMFCEGIYISRNKGNLRREEELFRRLLFIYRTPALLSTLMRRRSDRDKLLPRRDQQLQQQEQQQQQQLEQQPQQQQADQAQAASASAPPAEDMQ